MKESHRFPVAPAPLTLAELASLLKSPQTKLYISEASEDAIRTCRNFLAGHLKPDGKPVYGINTGFGYLCNTRIQEERLEDLQVNLIRSHAAGTGQEVRPEIVRTMLLLKIKSLAYGHSGVRLETVERLVEFYNRGVYPVVYEIGSLGASGDLAPLAHLSLPLIGEGEALLDRQRLDGQTLHKELGLDPIRLGAKEGLALLNGTQFMLAYAVRIALDGFKYLKLADRIAALSLDAFDGLLEPFQPQLHRIRPHKGQQETAAHILTLLEGSEIADRSKSHVQDPYSFRCVPQVHGASKDALHYATGVFLTEMNAVSDNPNVFPEDELILSGGNFHGQPLALALDFLSIALAEIGSISERRLFQLLSGVRGLPLFLSQEPGVNSGMMISQYTAAAMVSQNKQLCFPASVDTIPSSNGQEDHVSMGSLGALKCFQVLENLKRILAIEFLNATQALSFREPLKTGTALREMVEGFREVVPPVTADRPLQPDIDQALSFLEAQDEDWLAEIGSA